MGAYGRGESLGLGCQDAASVLGQRGVMVARATVRGQPARGRLRCGDTGVWSAAAGLDCMGLIRAVQPWCDRPLKGQRSSAVNPDLVATSSP